MNSRAATAAALSIVPGLGQFFVGQRTRGFALFLGFVGNLIILALAWPSLGPVMAETQAKTGINWLYPLAAAVAACWLWNMWDAWQAAEGHTTSFVLPILIAVVANLIAGLLITRVNVADLIAGLPKMKHIAWGLLRPEVLTDKGISPVLALSLKLIVDTIYLALIGTLLPIPITLVLSVLGARNLMSSSGAAGTIVYAAARSIMNVLRSIEVIIIAVMMTVAVGIGPFAGVLALAIHGIGAQGKLYSEAIEDIDPGPVEAITATGATWLQRVIYGVLPQVTPQFIAFTMYRWDINVRMATVIGLVGGGGIGYTLMQYINTLQWREAGTAIWLIAIAVILMDWASAAVRRKYA